MPELSINLAVGLLIVVVVSFTVTLSLLTYCVLIKLEKETSELINPLDIEIEKQEKEIQQHDAHGNPIIHTYEDEEFVF